MLTFIDNINIATNELEILDPFICPVNIMQYGIPVYQQYKTRIRNLASGKYKILVSDCGGYVLLSSQIEQNSTISVKDDSTYVSCSFGNYVYIAPTNVIGDVRQLNDIVGYSRFNARQMYNEVRKNNIHLTWQSMKLLAAYAKENVYPCMNDFDDPQMLMCLGAVENNAWSESILFHCSDVPRYCVFEQGVMLKADKDKMRVVFIQHHGETCGIILSADPEMQIIKRQLKTELNLCI